MPDPLTVQLAQRGQMTIPKSLRERYNLQTGDTLTLLDLDGVFVLSPRQAQVDQLADQIGTKLIDHGETLESMLDALRKARESYHARPGDDD
ncbi:MAG: AbrB/MazE/SpoVT family DNA-binding domain-containing protein [Chloroflexota bacterium]|nr:AbrB/MazE/SpoVT family DNA-binding domain-containing protein [Chloroflexota bacterium]